MVGSSKSLGVTMLTQERLKQLLDYSPDTGLFYWRVTRSGVKAGRAAGHTTEAGYIRITIEGRRYLAHVLAVLFMTGEFPQGQVDHRDLNTGNNIWSNLRVTTQSLNCANCRPRSTNKIGLKGVVRKNGKAKRTKPFVAQITVNQKTRCIGYFATPEEAHQAYLAEAHKAFGQFARAS
jgi:hypothetical protein